MANQVDRTQVPPGFFWGVYETYTWDRRKPNEANISVSGQRLRRYRLDDTAIQDKLLADFSEVFDANGALKFMHKWGLLVGSPKMKVVLAAAASVRWLLTVISALNSSEYDRILSWVIAYEGDKSYGDLCVWVNTEPGRDWMRKARCKYFPPYFEKLSTKIQSKPNKQLTLNERTVWSIYQSYKRKRGEQPYWKVYLTPTAKDRQRLKGWKGIINNANVDQTKDWNDIFMYVRVRPINHVVADRMSI